MSNIIITGKLFGESRKVSRALRGYVDGSKLNPLKNGIKVSQGAAGVHVDLIASVGFLLHIFLEHGFHGNGLRRYSNQIAFKTI